MNKSFKNVIIHNNEKFLDLSMFSGVLLLGHNHKIFRNTIKNFYSKKFSITNFYNDKTKKKIFFLIKKFFKNTKKLYFCTTGSEAVIKAIRISNAIKPKANKIAMINGSWHGSVDQTLFKLKNEFNIESISSGINRFFKDNLVMLPYNNVHHSIKILDKEYKDISCIIVEPIMGSLPNEDCKKYLQFLRLYCNKKKIILIFDEIITGIRTLEGSVQNKFNISPDITIAGKIIGGGLPISLIIVNDIVNKKIAKLKKNIFFGGTFTANNLSLFSCLNTLKYINKNKGIIKKICFNTLLLHKKISSFIKNKKIDAQIMSFDGFLRIIFTKKKVKNRSARDFLEKNKKNKIDKFKKFLFKKKIIYPNNGIIFISNQFSMKNVDFVSNMINQGLLKYFK